MARGQVPATVGLLDDGGTVPFIARYRKEQTASLDEVAKARFTAPAMPTSTGSLLSKLSTSRSQTTPVTWMP